MVVGAVVTSGLSISSCLNGISLALTIRVRNIFDISSFRTQGKFHLRRAVYLMSFPGIRRRALGIYLTQ